MPCAKMSIPRLSSAKKPTKLMREFLESMMAYADEHGLEVTGILRDRKTGAVVMFTPDLCWKHVDCGPLYLMRAVHEMQHHAEGAVTDAGRKRHPRRRRQQG